MSPAALPAPGWARTAETSATMNSNARNGINNVPVRQVPSSISLPGRAKGRFTTEPLRLAGKAQPAGLLERLDVEGSQFIDAVDFDEHDKTPRRRRARDQARTFGQRNN